MNHWILALFLLSIAGCPIRQSHYDLVDWESHSPKGTEPGIIETPDSLQILLKLHNDQRELKGRSGFQLDPYLSQYAQKHSDWMASANKLKHSSIGALMNKYSTVGENIAWNQKTEAEVVDAWMHSSGHRANIMNRNFTKIGFGISYNRNGEPYWCTCFGG